MKFVMKNYLRKIRKPYLYNSINNLILLSYVVKLISMKVVISQSVHDIQSKYLPPKTIYMSAIPGYIAHDSPHIVEELAYIKQHYAPEYIVTLNGEAELVYLKLADLPDRVREIGCISIHYPIADLGIPNNMSDFHDFITRIAELVRQKQRIWIHCRAGLGRTGTVAACLLVYLGASPYTAIADVRHSRPHTIETDRQMQFVHDYAQWYILQPTYCSPK